MAGGRKQRENEVTRRCQRGKKGGNIGGGRVDSRRGRTDSIVFIRCEQFGDEGSAVVLWAAAFEEAWAVGSRQQRQLKHTN